MGKNGRFSLLAISDACSIIPTVHGVWRSLVARFVRVEEAIGSNPVTPTKQKVMFFANMAFFVRQRRADGNYALTAVFPYNTHRINSQ